MSGFWTGLRMYRRQPLWAAAQTLNPSQRPGMNDKHTLARALRGPLMLITVGLLFLLDQHDIPFYRTWPILFIVFGCLKLVERLVGPAASQGSLPPGVWPPEGGVPR